MFDLPLRTYRRAGRALPATALMTGVVLGMLPELSVREPDGGDPVGVESSAAPNPAMDPGGVAAAAPEAAEPEPVVEPDGGQATATEGFAAFESGRDVLRWPFARDSIWNTPIGSEATYVPAGLQPANAWKRAITADAELISIDPSDPLARLMTPGQPSNSARVHVARDLAHNGSWNGCATLLNADGRTVWSGQPLRLSPGGSPTWTYTTQSAPSDLRGDGIEGCHGGSRMSGIGGSLRTGELASAEPLRHALKVNLFCKKYCYKGGSQADSKRWPALTADGYWARGYGGQLPALKMGALLALPPGVDLSRVTDPKARKLAVALRDYGAYLVDDTAWDVHAFGMDHRVVASGEWPAVSNTAFHGQLQQVFSSLAVVDDNAPGSVGGGGTPRAPLAPCFTGDAGCPRPGEGSRPVPVPSAPPVAPAPPVTPDAGTDLQSRPATDVVNGWGPVERGTSNGERGAGDGAPLRIGGRTYDRGLGVHAGSSLTYDLDDEFRRFTATVGVDDEVGDRGSVVFEVWVDGRLQHRSPTLTGAGGEHRIDVDVVDAEELRLVVTDAGDGTVHDHADWAQPRLVPA